MKNIIKSLPGKILLFVLTLLLGALTAAFLAGGIFFVSENLYDKNKSEEKKNYINTRLMEYAINDILNSGREEVFRGGINGEMLHATNFHYLLFKENSRIEWTADEKDRDVLDRKWTFDREFAAGDIVHNYVSYEDTDENSGITSYEVSISTEYDIHPLGNNGQNSSYAERKQARESGQSIYRFMAFYEGGVPDDVSYQLYCMVLDFVFAFKWLLFPLAFICLMAAFTGFCLLMSVSARRKEEGLFPGPFNFLPFDFLIVAVAIISVVPLYMGVEFFGDYYNSVTIIYICAWALIIAALILGLCMSAASRIKQKNLFKNTLIYKFLRLFLGILKRIAGFIRRCFGFFVHGLGKVHSVKKGILFLFVLVATEIAAFAFIVFDMEELGIFLIFVINSCIAVVILYCSANFGRIFKAGEELAEGNYAYELDTSGMRGDFLKLGENLNGIAGGIGLAVEEKMKSERMKTELITNVSHDIKTPLTSIINFAGLISKEECDNPKIREYSEVLTRQSDRLKRLIEDLVEASKASSGNLEVELMPCEAELFIRQTAGEYEEKFGKRNLTIITKLPEDEHPHIMADGRRMLRVFDNLMNNIYKYAQEGTRVYLSMHLEKGDNEDMEKVVFTFKNTSAAELDISADELMERFVRGDKSRNTDGNGLGLSIAKSLTELQNGTLSLSIDGDLFKAELTFDSCS